MKHKLILEDWDYECGDGCCYEYGTRLTINDKIITENFECYSDDIELVLKELNVDFEIKILDIHGNEY